MKNETLLSYLPEIKERIVNKFHPEKIILFGSAAKTPNGEGNDLDLLIVFHSVINKRELTRQVFSTVCDLPISIDFVVTSTEKLKSQLNKNYSIESAAVSEGKIIYESK